MSNRNRFILQPLVYIFGDLGDDSYSIRQVIEQASRTNADDAAGLRDIEPAVADVLVKLRPPTPPPAHRARELQDLRRQLQESEQKEESARFASDKAQEVLESSQEVVRLLRVLLSGVKGRERLSRHEFYTVENVLPPLLDATEALRDHEADFERKQAELLASREQVVRCQRALMMASADDHRVVPGNAQDERAVPSRTIRSESRPAELAEPTTAADATEATRSLRRSTQYDLVDEPAHLKRAAPEGLFFSRKRIHGQREHESQRSVAFSGATSVRPAVSVVREVPQGPSSTQFRDELTSNPAEPVEDRSQQDGESEGEPGRDKLQEALDLCHFAWDITDDELEEFKQGLLRKLHPKASPDAFESSADTHLVGAFTSERAYPPPCFLGGILAASHIKGGPKSAHSTCHWCKARSMSTCFFATFADGVDSGFGKRVNGVISSSRGGRVWRKNRHPRTVQIGGRDVRYIVHKRKAKANDIAHYPQVHVDGVQV